MFVTVKFRDLNSDGGTNGWGARAIRKGKSAVATAPIARATKARGSDQLRCPP